MQTPLPAPLQAMPLPAGLSDQGDPLLDVKLLREMAGFPLRSLRRHRRISALIAAVTMGFVVLVALVMPRQYSTQTRILAQRNIVMPALANPRRNVPTESDAPTKLASETVLQRDNLVAIVQETNLLAHWDQIRSPLGRLKDRIQALTSRPLTDAERLDRMVDLLGSRLWVQSAEGPDGTVSIGVHWPEPQGALAIVEAAQEKFFQQRHTSEVARIGESITMIERYVAQSRGTMDSTLRVLAAQAPLPPRSAMPRATAPVVVSPEVAGLRATLSARRALIQDLTAQRADRLNVLHSQLADLQKSYGAAHPDVKALQSTIATLSVEPQQLVALRAEEKTIVGRLAALGAPEIAPANSSPPTEPLLARAALERLARSDVLNDPQEAYAQAQLKMMIDKYEDFLDRLESARIEMETARAAFKYRYNVVTPAQLPKAPDKSRVLLIVGGVFLAVSLAAFGAIALDLMSGRVLENWQVERLLKLPVLGTVERP